MLAGGERDVEVGPAALDALDQVVAADEVGAGLLRVAGAFALGEDEHAYGLAEAVGQQRRAADLLVGVARVEAGAHVQLDGLVELGGRGLLGQVDRLLRRVGLVSCRSASTASLYFLPCFMA